MDGELGGRVFEGPGGNLQKCGRGKERGGAETKKIKKKVTSSMYFLWLTYYNLGRAFHLEGRNFLERLRRLNHYLTARSCCY